MVLQEKAKPAAAPPPPARDPARSRPGRRASCSSPPASCCCSLWPGSCGGPTWNPTPGSSEAVKDFARGIWRTADARAAPPDGPPAPVPGLRRAGCGAAPATAGPSASCTFPVSAPDYTRPIVQGTTPDVLDTLGLGPLRQHRHARGVGNFAVAGHRQTARCRPGQHPHPGARGQDLRPDPGRLLRLRLPEQPDSPAHRGRCPAAGADAGPGVAPTESS